MTPFLILLVFTTANLKAAPLYQPQKIPGNIIAFIENIPVSNLAEKNSTEKILLVTVDETGNIKVNNDPVGSDFLANYIQERLFKSYMGTGEMHSRIKLEKLDTTVPDLVMEAVINEIKDGQKKALVSVCLLKYNKLFDGLDKKKQDKLLKQFPVLFQTDYL